ncbi:hypothetical protein SK128_020003 [Halocaridina rubra]|uniref:Ionotropic glutamate receptor C-terminal domain-containing protein n=1 Tax=Halocaridina rubra TaxID=373956 RepID=A0AAN8WPM5_HALRR
MQPPILYSHENRIRSGRIFRAQSHRTRLDRRNVAEDVQAAVVVGLGFAVPMFAAKLLSPDVKELYDFSGAFLVAVAFFCNTGANLPRTTPMQVLIGFCILAGFTTTVYYSCNLTAFMMVKAIQRPFTSFAQIAKSNLTISGFGIGWKYMMMSSQEKNIRNLANRYYTAPDTTGNIRNVVRGETAQISSSLHNEYLISVYYTNRLGESPIRIMYEECLNPFSVGAIAQKNSPLLPAINEVILRLQEGGVINKFHEDMKKLDKLHVPYSKEYLGYNSSAFVPVPKLQPLSALHMQGSFFLLGVGCLLSLLIFWMEIGWSSFKTSGASRYRNTNKLFQISRHE